MNKAITDGLVFTPSEFADGLDVWSSQDGTVGQDTYAGAANAAFVPADQDFGGCLELQKTTATQKLRYMGQTQMLAGCYLRITARVKAVSGNLATVRIAGWAGTASDAHVGGLVEVGPSVTLTTYGEVITVSAIVGAGVRGGVDMQWGSAPAYGHFGLDLTGPTGGVVRIDDIQIEDITSAFLRDMMDWVDVKDYGAIGDGVANDQPAFEAADAAANGRRVLISSGTYYLADHVTFENPVRFEGTVVMPVDKRLVLSKNFDLPTYINAFGDETLALKKALQTLLNYSDHDSLDMGGRRVELTGPIDVHAAVANRDTFEVRRVLRNGQINVVAGPNWDTDVVSSAGTYAINNPKTLTAVANVANIQVGSLVTGGGVGREVYVRSKNVGAATVTLSQPLYDAVGTQSYTFKRFKYVLDFSGFTKMSRFILDDVEIQCGGEASAVMIPPDGKLFQMRDCYIVKPKDRAITSIGIGCQDIHIDRNQFISNEQLMRAQDRTTIVFNVNKNDAKVRDNQSHRFGHFGVLAGAGSILAGNHWYQGDLEPDGLRTAGVIFTGTNLKSIINGNYIDNSYIELTNEHDADPNLGVGYTFGGLTVTGNIFTVNDSADWFNWFVVKPYGTGHSLQGLNITGNTFRSINGSITRVERVDTTFADLDYWSFRNIVIDGNTFNAVVEQFQNPVTVDHTQASNAQNWAVSFSPYLPFKAYARRVSAVIADGKITSGTSTGLYTMPYTTRNTGANFDQVRLTWSTACKGKVRVTARIDNPI
ncbi:MAG: hypothetical protein COB39_09585 [Marinosulfonomonas sp.]|nr:MAG: hypothetical protein COB39_09585 [Marinosulfonomonas sp.]